MDDIIGQNYLPQSLKRNVTFSIRMLLLLIAYNYTSWKCNEGNDLWWALDVFIFCCIESSSIDSWIDLVKWYSWLIFAKNFILSSSVGKLSELWRFSFLQIFVFKLRWILSTHRQFVRTIFFVLRGPPNGYFRKSHKIENLSGYSIYSYK